MKELIFTVKIMSKSCTVITTERHVRMGRSQWPCSLRRGSLPLGCRDRGFDSRFGHGCLSAFFYVVLSCTIGKTENKLKSETKKKVDKKKNLLKNG
jgi:hypothetical protein